MQAQNNEIAESLSVSLKNAQNRADELEFQLSRLRQVSVFFLECIYGYD